MQKAQSAEEARNRIRVLTMDLQAIQQGKLQVSPGFAAAAIELLGSVSDYLKEVEHETVS